MNKEAHEQQKWIWYALKNQTKKRCGVVICGRTCDNIEGCKGRRNT